MVFQHQKVRHTSPSFPLSFKLIRLPRLIQADRFPLVLSMVFYLHFLLPEALLLLDPLRRVNM